MLAGVARFLHREASERALRAWLHLCRSLRRQTETLRLRTEMKRTDELRAKAARLRNDSVDELVRIAERDLSPL